MGWGLVAPALLWTVAFFVLPFAAMLALSFGHMDGRDVVQGFDPGNYIRIFTDWTMTKALLNSVEITLMVTAVSVVLAYPLAAIIAFRVPRRWQRLALLLAVLLWQRLGRMQEQLARQSQDAGQQSLEAKAWAKQAQDTVKDNTARLGLIEGRLGEVALQRGQLEELIQSLSRSRDENLVVDIDSGLRMAQQQAQLTGSTEPLMATLKSAQQRLQRAAQPRLAPVQRAIDKDLERR